MKALLGKKLGMTQVFADDRLIPVTVIEAGPCLITQIKNEEVNGYRAVQIGFGEVKDKHLTKPLKGHFVKVKVKPRRYLAEYALTKEEQVPEVGSQLSCNIFESGELANITAVSKGKGFQGVVKRWGFAGGPGGHGSHFHRAPGSIGMAATPSRVFKGMKMAGRLGGKQVTTKNLEIIKVDESQNVILVKGAVPGGKNALVMIKSTGKKLEPARLQTSDARPQTPDKEKVGPRPSRGTRQEEESKEKPKPKEKEKTKDKKDKSKEAEDKSDV